MSGLAWSAADAARLAAIRDDLARVSTATAYTMLFAKGWRNVYMEGILPIAPLDGSHLTPRSMDNFQRKIAPYSGFILMGILMIPPLANVLIRLPAMLLANGIMSLFGLV